MKPGFVVDKILPWAKDVADHSRREAEDAPTAGALNDPSGNQGIHILGQGADKGADKKDKDGGQEDGLSAENIA